MDMLSRLFESLIVTLREGIEVALVVGILLGYLRRTGRAAYTRQVFLGLGAALLMSLLGAVLIYRYGLNPENPVAEGVTMFVAAGLVTSLVVWMWRTGRTVKRRLEQRLDALVGRAQASAVTPRAALGVFGFTFVMMLREGIETVLFLSALSGTVGGSPLYNLLGGSLGLLLATLFGVLLVRGSLHINLRRFFAVTGFVLLILVAKLIAGGLHEFFEVGLLPATPLLEEAIEVLTDRTASLIVLLLLMALPGACMAWDWWRQSSAAQASLPPQPNGARS
ncbi:MAG TPA: FTR1 family protein [Candidatus Methylomirabilis sp.]|nr:FTR1 family protein [Candidatus Methylomirabilis sp.]